MHEHPRYYFCNQNCDHVLCHYQQILVDSVLPSMSSPLEKPEVKEEETDQGSAWAFEELLNCSHWSTFHNRKWLIMKGPCTETTKWTFLSIVFYILFHKALNGFLKHLHLFLHRIMFFFRSSVSCPIQRKKCECNDFFCFLT